ncbi:glyoxalase [Zhihengliuella salsuginis]|uniref:Glyoxalase n=2 Tax=Zhihengliuella salsuginis TaxID=578222 RepID=A0ABQ3GFW5_9MICC|nr:glyoxalase [Zhihengliuella salsuginis]
MIFVNLPTDDLAAADAFYGALGFTKNEQFSDENASSWVISDVITIMVLKREYFATFLVESDAPHLPGARGAHEVLNALSCESSDEVDQLMSKAVAGGGSAYREADAPFPGMYQGAFADPDGHVWEVAWMDPEAMQG